MCGGWLIGWLLIGFSSIAPATTQTKAMYRYLLEHMKFTSLANEGHGIQFLYEKKPEIYTWLLRQHK